MMVSPIKLTTAMMMQRLPLALGFALALGCRGESSDDRATSGATASAAGDVASKTRNPEPRAPGLPPNRLGRIPILEYHVVGDSNNGMFTVSREHFRNDLQTLYDRGYRPITVAQLLDRDFSAVPAGMSPVVFTFDDASPEQFSYIERDGQLEVDPQTALGIWLDFAKERPDWKGRATFCLLPAGDAGHAFFGDKEKYRGQKKDWRHQKVKWLADNGFELCNHTLWHAQLSKYPDGVVQEQIARGQLAIDSVVPGYKVRTFALPQGLWPRNKELAWRGSWTDPATKKTTTYDYETVLKVAGGPARSPFDPQFDKRELTRVIAFGNAVKQTLDRLDANKTRFVWDSSTAPAQPDPRR